MTAILAQVSDGDMTTDKVAALWWTPEGQAHPADPEALCFIAYKTGAIRLARWVPRRFRAAMAGVRHHWVNDSGLPVARPKDITHWMPVPMPTHPTKG